MLLAVGEEQPHTMQLLHITQFFAALTPKYADVHYGVCRVFLWRSPLVGADWLCIAA